MPASREIGLAIDHWAYTRQVVESSLMFANPDADHEYVERILAFVKFFYQEAFIHGYKHAVECVQKNGDSK